MITQELYDALEERVTNLEMALAELIPDEEETDRAAEMQQFYRSKKGHRDG